MSVGVLYQVRWVVWAIVETVAVGGRAHDAPVPRVFFRALPSLHFGAILQDLVDTSAFCQIEKMGHDSRAVCEVISAWVRG